MKFGVELEFLSGMLDSADLETAHIRGNLTQIQLTQWVDIIRKPTFCFFFFIKTWEEEVVQQERTEEERGGNVKGLWFII